MSKTPYELRFEIFKQAYTMLQDNYNYQIEVGQRQNPSGLLPANFDAHYPTISDVLLQAEVLNNFVSETK